MVEKINFEQIKKLPPDKRIKALQEIENELQKFIDEKTKEIEESKKEIEASKELLARAKEELAVLEEIEVPKAKEIRIEELFRREEKEEKKTSLERIAEEAPRRLSPEQEQEYISALKQRPVEELYNRIVEIKNSVAETGVLTQYQQENLDLFAKALQEKEKDIEERQYKPGAKAKHLLTAAEQIVQYLKG